MAVKYTPPNVCVLMLSMKYAIRSAVNYTITT